MIEDCQGIWARLSPSGRELASGDLAKIWRSVGPPAARDIGRVSNFRPATVRKSDAARAQKLLLQSFPRLREPLRLNLLVSLHTEFRTDLLARAYNALDVPHDDSELREEAHAQVLSSGDCVPPCLGLAQEAGLEAVWLCFATMALTCPEGWQEAVAAVADAIEALLPEPGTIQGEATSVPEEPGAGSLAQFPSFSPLDRVLIRTVVSTLNEVEGSPDFDELDDLVQELIELNDARHQSRFHRGFVDALMIRDCEQRGSADNQNRRSWYLVGYLLGRLRQHSVSDALALFDELDDRDCRDVLSPNNEAGAMLAPEVLPHLLQTKKLADAEVWIQAHAIPAWPKIFGTVMEWSDEELLTSGDATGACRVLQLFAEKLRSVPEDHSSVPPPTLVRALERRCAIALRIRGQQTEAAIHLGRLLDTCDDEQERSRLLAQQALVSLGIQKLESLRLPEDLSERRKFVELLVHHSGSFQEAGQGSRPSPLALYALALPVVAEPNSSTEARDIATAHLLSALEEMVNSAAPVWEKSGLQDAARFGLAVLGLRSDAPGSAESAAERLHQLLLEGVDAPSDLILDAVTDAILRDAPAASKTAELALRRLGHAAIAHLDLPGLCQVSAGFRSALAGLLDETADLRASELWVAWKAVLESAMSSRARDPELGARALDALEGLSAEPPRTDEFLAILQDATLVDPAWVRTEREEAKFQALLRADRIEDARAALRQLAHEVVSEGHTAEAQDLIERAVDLGALPEELRPLRARLESQEPPKPSSDTPAPSIPVTILFVGGNETQEKYRDRLVAELRDTAPNAIVDFELPGWGANWGRLLDHLDERVSRSDAVVIMRFVRTGLGRALRRMASKHGRPWIACSGHGFASLQRAIEEAVRVAVEAKRDGVDSA